MLQRKRLTGTVKWFSVQRKYGFLAPDIGGEDLFVHYSSIRSEGFRMITQGDLVEFSVEKGENGRMKAVNVTCPAGTEIPVEESRSKGGGVGREEVGRGGGRIWGRNGRAFVGSCYNCGQNGHLARDCPRSYQGEAGGGGACYTCGKSGHLMRDCKQNSGSNGRGFGGSCYNCGQIGHLARDCKQERANFVNFSIDGYSGGGRGCYNCGEPRHLARDCPNN